MILEKTVKYLLFVTALTPLIYTPSLIFPFVTGKVLFFRLIVGVALILFSWLLVLNNDVRRRYLKVLKQPLVILVLLFFVSLIISSALAVSPYAAFWSNLERGEGLFTMLHFLVFFLLSITVFSWKDWHTFVKWSLVVGLIAACFGIVWPSAILGATASNTWSTLGNSSYVGGYFLMILGLAMWLWSSVDSPPLIKGENRSKRRGNLLWRYLALSTAAASVAMIFWSASRGAMLALFVGVVVWLVYGVCKTFFRHPERSEGSQRDSSSATSSGLRMTVGALIVLILLISGFWMTKDQPIWQEIPGLDRLSKMSLSHPTVQTRLLSLGSSWEAFKEKPIFGWGPENFLVAYNEHYNPKYALYEAAWFDRAHNKLADVLVMQGLFGILAYLGIFVMAFWYLLFRRRSRHPEASAEGSSRDSSLPLRMTKGAAPLAILLLMYFFQNLFVFDHPSSYLLFFGVLGLVASVRHPEASAEGSPRKRSSWPWSTMAIALTILLLYSAYAYHYVVFRQAKSYLTTIQKVAEINQFSSKVDEFLEPYNYSQTIIRGQLMDFLGTQDAFKRQESPFIKLGDKAIGAMEEYVAKEGMDPRDYIRLSEAYNDRAKSNPEYFEKSELVLREALKLAPRRQEIYYHLAFSLAGAGKGKEAVEVARQAVELEPEVARAHYMLGVILSLIGDRVAGERAIEKALEMDKGLFLLEQDSKNILEIYGDNFIFYIQQRDLAGVEKTINRLKQFESNKEAIPAWDRLLEMAQEGRWEELKRTVELIAGSK